MDQNGLLAALDLGTTRFRAVVAEPDGKGGVAIHGHASLPARGMDRGELSDLPAAATAIREVVAAAAEEAEADVTDVGVSVIGDSVRSLAAHGVVSLDGHGGAVRREHLELAHERVQSMGIPFDRVILHCLPIEYCLDDRRGLKNPVDMIGARLELDAHLITGTQSALSALDRAVEMAGLHADPLVFGPCATSLYLLEQAEREQGCLLIDIGGEVTHYALFCRGRMRQSGVVPVGGNHVTRDLAYGLSVEPAEAERTKRRWGSALRSAAVHQPPRADDAPPEIRGKVVAICEARQQEILELVAQGLQWGITRPTLAAGIVLTGGGSRLPGTVELTEQVFQRRAQPRRAPGDDYGDEPDSWSTVLGLVQHDLERERTASTGAPVLARAQLWENVKHWIGRLV